MNKLRPVRHVPAKKVREFYKTPLKRGGYAMEESQKLFEDGFPVRFVRNFHVEHRPAELHLHEDDLLLCMCGNVRFIVGGRLINPWTEDNLTFFADNIDGGEEIVLYEGDWLHVPAGRRPHQHFTTHLCHLMVVKAAPPESRVSLDYLTKKPRGG